jgi:plasmid stabilization system protein ParE
MSVYALTPLAKADIFDIWSFIAQDSEDAAEGGAGNLQRVQFPCRGSAARPFPSGPR